MAERDMKQSTGALALDIWKNSEGYGGSGTGSSSLTTFTCKVNYFCVDQSSQYLGYNNSWSHNIHMTIQISVYSSVVARLES